MTQQEQFLSMLESSFHIFNIEIKGDKTEITVNPNSQHVLYAYFTYPLGELILVRS